ncbi:alpha/beta fold hydrolase [Mesorhizobium carmichaelinearum]|uniref:alpha/beta fold hydrolase n=1 Tax=Mesorhizobium carmichaelinearum TaxID=1208188 RepID=UPI000BA44B50|nr:alpha/beta fold hydrolase [Mesorhizobium carmichaelinearum]
MTTFVMVHGARHGGWCWRKVAQSLNVLGSDLYTPTLTGLGERAHLASPDIDLETHICDVLGLLETEDLKDVVLVGHSYAGIVASGAADRAVGRIARVVYLDAIVPRDGLYDCASAQARDYFEEQARVGVRAGASLPARRPRNSSG